MSGLDKIIKEILRQAGTQAEEILAEARQKAAAISEKGRAEREALQTQLEAAAEPELQAIASRSESANRQARRLALLTVRNEVLDEVMEEAKARLQAQAGSERFQVAWQGDILLNNSIDAIFETEAQTLRDIAYRSLTGGAA